MFRVETTDPARLKRIAAAGTGALLLGLVLVGVNLVVPILTGGLGALDAEAVAFGVFGLLTVVLVTHPTYQAARQLDES